MIVMMDGNESGSGERLTRHHGTEALAALREQVNHEGTLRTLGMEPGFLDLASALARQVPVFRFRPRQAIGEAARSTEHLKALFLEVAS